MHISDYDDNISYLKSRLSGALFKETLYKDFIFIQEVSGTSINNSVAMGFNIISGGLIRLEIPVQNIDINPFPIGNINYKKESVYAMRIPNRTYKQGLWGENLYCKKFYIPADTAEVFTTLRGQYPSLYKSTDLLLSEENSSVAISRSLSVKQAEVLADGSDLVSSTLVLNSELPIGSLKFRVEDSFVSVQLLEEYSYLTEYVEEEMKGVSAC